MGEGKLGKAAGVICFSVNGFMLSFFFLLCFGGKNQ